ncbi:unnamed protein product [Brassica rapa]|uniref:Retrotransposon gag domain-containing protein n=2 Tax=Brassica campestris TaxID=3711 RepID=A0A8D9HAP8_BRACM|nr:unnamed protein product [Brassica rapa]
MFSLDHYEWRMPRMHYGRRNTREYAQRRNYDMEGNLVLPMMFSLDHYEWRMPRMHYGRRNTREYAQRRNYDMEGNLVLPMFTDPEEQYREFPFRYPHEQTVRHKVLMPHFQRMAMEERLLQGNARFQLATEEGPPRKRGRPCKPPSAAGGPPRVFTGKCQCGVLIKNAQEDRSVAGYTEDFINQAKLCKPKNAETWCVWYKNGLRKELQAQLRDVLEPLEFALVRRMAGFAMEAEEKIAADVAALSSMEGGNPGRDVDGHEVPVGELAKGKRGRPRKPPTVTCDCDVLVQMVQKPRKVRDYLEEFLDTAKRCQPKPVEEWCHLFKAGLRGDIREELVGVLEPLEFALVRRMANQALHAEEWLAESEAAAEYDRVAEGDEDLGSETRCPSPCQCG